MTIEELLELVSSRKNDPQSEASTSRLLQQGVHAIGKKLVEEAAESWMAARYEDREALATELSQVIYYVVCMMVANDLSLAEVYEKL